MKRKTLKNLGQVATAQLVQRVIGVSNGVFLSPIVIIYFDSYVKSIVVLSFISIVMCIALIMLYDFSKKDWLFLEELKQTQNNLNEDVVIGKSSITKKIAKWSNKNKGILFLLIVCLDPTIAVLYYRKGSYLYNGIKELKIAVLFLVSTVVYNTIFTYSATFIIWLCHLITNL